MASASRDNETSDNELSALNNAIDYLSKSRLQGLLKRLCINSPGIRAKVTKALLVTYDEAWKAEASTDEDESTTDSAPDGEEQGKED
jgi:hypothetical protein